MSEREAYEAAERLVREAHAKAEEAARAAAASAPPNGWAGGAGKAAPDFHALLALVDAAKGTLPPELLRQLADALRELLIALRAVLDYSIEKLEPPAPQARDVEDIPIT
jgi:hypothetical protein